MADDKLISRMIARKAFAGLFLYCHTHPSEGVDCLLFLTILCFSVVWIDDKEKEEDDV